MKDITVIGIFEKNGNFVADVVSENSNDRATQRKKRNTIGQETISKKRDYICQKTRKEKDKNVNNEVEDTNNDNSIKNVTYSGQLKMI